MSLAVETRPSLPRLPGLIAHAPTLLPGLAASVGVALAALGAEWAEIGLAGGRWVDGLVFAILLGTAARHFGGLGARLRPGVDFAAKYVLEAAIVLLGASVSASALAGNGLGLPLVVAGVVLAGLASSYGLGRLVGLPHPLALLVACGNSICGNSAIVAVAPVIGARGEDVAAAIAFTAALGIVVVLGLPLAGLWGGMDPLRFGMLAGMTVYAVPQVLAATLPLGLVAAQVGALVKLMRVLMLGPVVLMVGLLQGGSGTARLPLTRLVPWFVIGFVGLMALNSFGALPAAAQAPLGQLQGLFTLVAMAALGLQVDLKALARSGGRVLLAGMLSLAALGAISLVAIHLILPTLAGL